MRRLALQILAVPASIASTIWFLASPAWCTGQVFALILICLSVGILLGRLAAFLAIAALIAMQGSNPHGSNGFVIVVLPLVAILSACGLLACVVVRNPGLAREIDPGGGY